MNSTSRYLKENKYDVILSWVRLRSRIRSNRNSQWRDNWVLAKLSSSAVSGRNCDTVNWPNSIYAWFTLGVINRKLLKFVNRCFRLSLLSSIMPSAKEPAISCYKIKRKMRDFIISCTLISIKIWWDRRYVDKRICRWESQGIVLWMGRVLRLDFSRCLAGVLAGISF